MISVLEGILARKGKKDILVMVSGVGYKIFVSQDTLAKLPHEQSPVTIYTAHEVREDSQELYGFLKHEELEFFETLRTVSGIGPKTALAILSLAPVHMLAQAILNNDASFLTKVSGVGRKTAERIVIDLKDKIAELGFTGSQSSKKDGDLVDALTKMGYGVKESAQALSHVDAGILGEEARLKAALKFLSKN